MRHCIHRPGTERQRDRQLGNPLACTITEKTSEEGRLSTNAILCSAPDKEAAMLLVGE